MISFEDWIKRREPQYYEDLTAGEKALYEEIYDLEQAVLENSITSVFNDFIPFLEAMEEEYLRHYPEKGESWKTEKFWVPTGRSAFDDDHMGHWETTDSLLKRKIRDVGYKFFKSYEPDELVDLANLCAMLWIRLSTQTVNEVEN